MKKLILVITWTVVLTTNIFASDEPTREEWRNMSRSERKAYKEKVAEKEHAQTKELLESQAWVLEATQLQDRYGETYIIESTLNFVGINKEEASVQLGTSHDVGYNGVGGITLDGRVLSYEISEGNRKNSGFSVTMNLMGSSMGSTTIMMHVSGSGSARATVTTIEGDRVTYSGDIVPLNESRVYKGTTTY